MSVLKLIFPNQLFEFSPLFIDGGKYILIEENLFFNQYAFHKQKLAFHRASMKFYQNYLLEKGFNVDYIEATEQDADIRLLIDKLAKQKIDTLQIIDPTDNWLESRIKSSCTKHSIGLEIFENPNFLNTKQELKSFFRPEKKKFFQTEFYIQQRKSRKILLDKNNSPIGAKWSFDSDNRKKYPKSKTPPPVLSFKVSDHFTEAKEYVLTNFPKNPGELSEFPFYPINHEQSEEWFTDFLNFRFHEFGPYEDALVSRKTILNHSLLSPLLNVGLLRIEDVLNKSLNHAKKYKTPINSTEGFVRQIIGWREFIRGIYEVKGSYERTRNYWGFKRKIPNSFYDGTTGIAPIDITIKKVLKAGYCHHIERLMVLGNFMILCEFDPNEVYRWFMELFIDAYDWVMVPNVYGMSQFADGGLMSTKPYISGSNYLMKMSNYDKGDWQSTWDALFWRFMNVHRNFFLKNPRLGMLIRTFDKMPLEKQLLHMKKAENYLISL